MSLRKQHQDLSGYVAERQSHHPALPGHFVLIDRKNGGDWIDAQHRWVVIHFQDHGAGSMVSFPSQRSARSVMSSAAAGGDDVDFGQIE